MRVTAIDFSVLKRSNRGNQLFSGGSRESEDAMFRLTVSAVRANAIYVSLVALPLGLACIVTGAKGIAFAPEPDIVITPLVADLGKINQGDRKDVVFTIRNNSGYITTIIPATRSSCSCVRMVGGPADLTPGQTYDFHALVDTSLYPGSFEREAAFVIKGLTEKSLWANATIRAEVTPEYTLVPSKLVLDTEHKTARIKIVPGFRSGISIVSVDCSASNVASLVQDAGRIAQISWELPEGSVDPPRTARLVIRTTSLIEGTKYIPVQFVTR